LRAVLPSCWSSSIWSSPPLSPSITPFSPAAPSSSTAASASCNPMRCGATSPCKVLCDRLRIERSGERSVVRAAFARSPLRLLTPGNHGRAAWVYASTLGGGLVDGDQIRLDVEVSSGAACVLSSQGESRIYPSPRGCSHELRAEVEERGLLVVIPDPTVCFASARYRQRTEISLAPTAAVALSDVLLAGRSAYGERWALWPD